MKMKQIVKPTVIGGIVAATLFSPLTPLRTMGFGERITYAANPISTNVVSYSKQNMYDEGKTFKDVTAGRWYSSAVKQAYEYGLISGKAANSYEPQSNLTIAEALTLAAKLHSYGSTGAYEVPPAPDGMPWYTNVVNYCFNNNIIQANEFTGRYNNKATRAEVAHIFANVYGEGLLPKINKVTSLPDVRATDKYASDIYELYEAGILSGSDANGTFNPNSNITRAEIASIIMRMALPTQRVSMPKYGGGAVPATNDFPRISIGSGTSTTTPVVKPDTGTTVMPTTPENGTDKPAVKPETTRPESGSSASTTRPETSTSTNTTRPETSTSTNTTRPSDNNNKPDESKKENTIVKDGFTYVDDGTGDFYIYCKAGMDLSKLVAKNGYKVSEFMSPGIDPADIEFVPYSGNSAVIELQPPAGAKRAYLSITPVKDESTRPDPQEFADWFFEIFRNGSKVGLSYGLYDHRPSNYPECAAAIINHLRSEKGLSTVQVSNALNMAAEIRTHEIALSFSHTRPNGLTFGDLATEVGCTSNLAENIAGGDKLTDAMSAWIDSPGHYATMAVAKSREYIGISSNKDGTVLLMEW